jgi:hypothetical protein
MNIDLPNIKDSRIGLIYVYYERKDQQKNQTNLSFFIKYGLRNDKWLKLNIESLFVINGHQCEVVFPNKPNINILKDNNCSDWEGWLNGIKFYENKYNKPIWEMFDYLCLINCGSFGPIYEDNINDHWLIPFYDRMVKYNAIISSPCLSFLPNTNPSGTGPKVVPIFSLLRCTEHIITLLTKEQTSCRDDTSIDLYYKNKMISTYNTHTNTVFGVKYDKIDSILTGEYGLSRMLINNGYKVTSLLYDFDCHDEKFWSINSNVEPDRYNKFNGTNIPLSTIFIKHLWRLDNSYVSLPVLYNECMEYMFSKLNMKRLIYSNNLNYELLNINSCDFQYGLWNSKTVFYNKFGYCEENIIFNKTNVKNNLVIYAHYDAENIIKDYVIQSLNILIFLGYNIHFVTASETIININTDTLPFKINYIQNKGHGTDWHIWYEQCKYIINNNLYYDNILFLNDSIILPINGIDNFKNTLTMMRESSDFWGHWESNEIEWHIIGAPFEFKYKILNDITNFIGSYIEQCISKQDYVNLLETKMSNYLRTKGYRHNTTIKTDFLDNNIICPVFNPINIYKWINKPETFAIKWKYMISYIHPNFVSQELNYLIRFLYYGKYGIISEAEKVGAFPSSSICL